MKIEYRLLSKKNISYVWFLALPILFLLLIDVVFLVPAFPSSSSEELNIPMLIIGSISSLLTLIYIVLIVIFLITPNNLLEISLTSLRVNKTRNKPIDIPLSEIESVSFKKFINSFSGFLIIKAGNKKVSILLYDNADSVYKYLKQLLKI
ncbi:MAG: hypothetical protein WCR97_03305 [Bacilli bacterium]